MAQQFGDGIRLDLGIGVYGHHDFRFCLGHRQAERGGLAAVHLMNDVYARIGSEMFIEQRAGAVRGPVIDDNDLQIFCVGSQHGGDRLHDYVFFVMSRNQNGHIRRRIGHHVVIWAKFFYQGKNADDHRAATYQNYSYNEDGGETYAEPAVQTEDESIRARFESLLWRQGQHHRAACFVQQIRDRYKLVALSAKAIDYLRQSRDRLGAITAAVVKKDNVAFARLGQNVIDYVGSGNLLAAGRFPIMGTTPAQRATDYPEGRPSSCVCQRRASAS